MKIQIDIDGELWAKFRESVQSKGKTLREITPTVIEPALKTYLEPPIEAPQPVAAPAAPINEERFKPNPELILSATRSSPPPPVPTVRRCELCDMPSERLFASGVYKVCYSCWKGALTNKNAPSSETPSSASGAVS